MGNYFTDFNVIDDKLVKLLDEHQLVRRFNTDTYPITLTISQNMAPEAQMAMFSVAEDGASSRDAKLIISFPVGDIGLKTYGRLVITDKLMSKIKGLGKSLHYLFLQGHFAMMAEQKVFTRVQPIDPEEDEENDPGVDEDGFADPDDFGDFFDDEDTEQEDE